MSTLILAALGMSVAQWTAVGAGATMVMAYGIYLLGPGRHRVPVAASERLYPRIAPVLRWQHILMFTSFTILALTGLPLRFSHFPWAQALYLTLGGPGGARLVHRVAAVVLIASWVWHFAWLFVRWKNARWSLKSWTMFPAWKDVLDVLATAKLYFGLSHEEPKYERFQFREKGDYFAEYWGMPVMVISGFILWFPTYWGSRLPEIDRDGFGYMAFFSQDGGTWREHPGNPLFRDCDSLGLFWSAVAKRYICTCKSLQAVEKHLPDHGGHHRGPNGEDLQDRRVLCIRSALETGCRAGMLHRLGEGHAARHSETCCMPPATDA